MDSPDEAKDTPVSADMAREIARFRASLSASRSAAQLKLFDFLAERSADARSPKEIEIALAVFGNDAGLADSAGDSGVRVYVHRLRKRIDEFYAGQDGPRLVIPKGEYRLVLQAPEVTAATASRLHLLMQSVQRRAHRHLLVLAAIPCIAIAAAVLLPASDRIDSDTRTLGASRFWSNLDDGAPVTLAAGDSYLLAETRDQRVVSRLIRDPAIQSREQLGQHLKSHPDAFYRLYDLDLHFAPVGTAEAAWELQAALPPTRSGKVRKSLVVPLSGADEQALRAPTVVYVGRLADLGQLSSTFVATSRFRTDGDAAVRDLASGRLHVPPMPDRQDATPSGQSDLGLVASMRSADGRRIIFVTGLGDLATQDMVRLVTDGAALREIEQRQPGRKLYEALFEVRSIDGIQTDRRLVASHPLG
ncbi:hypothetical protein [Novosphingobium cyanobacteriorum]|uniref:OmpR/PhoB-type domain-containing protein n=1 Tax=Novosphingobium cyanobacteriorum TaxID=3024215 RepID=A0ABT6CIK6_9SPHN|nr:hypothetical protein [Novosphingobium cyanobacteriorum]MDF8333764.1 hypothetical protein [Novosphingobium cyanobacteriorum]